MSDSLGPHGLTAACQAPLSSTVSWSLLKFMSTESVMLTCHVILCCSLLLLSSVFPGIRVFSNELDLRVSRSQYQGFNLTISPSNEYSGLISFRIDRFDLVVQRTLKSLLQNNHLKASILSKGQTCKQKSNAHFRILWSVKEKKMSYGEGNIRSIEC